MMPKKGNPKENRLDPASAGVDLDAILDEIRPHLADYAKKDLAEAMGINPVALGHVLNGHRKPNIAFLASLAAAIGGSLDVKFHPPRKR
ncbi:helix-turn-helix domain-containing protein [Rhodopirellula sp. P2]|uniref:helix-turn-helix domain-containing protein n=1 Tax=Rhodopirellula sp. P2 TaxID=2127060 RepID=UPI002368923B|nr:helix-turn-helix transcriptional regulator [Rhodopirellula sp. P2]WDQ16382.1 helix-turn-helix transcriptional regulator [Rhodopirellula sp. P2]